MFSKTNVTLETCTPDLAKAFAQMPALEGERDLRSSRLTFLRRHLKAGTFVSPSWATVVDAIAGLTYRANGHHSSTVLAELAPDDYPTGLLVTIEEYTTNDLAHDAALIFELFDNPKSARTNVDAMNKYLGHFPGLKKTVSAKQSLTLCNGIAWFEAGLGDNGTVYPTRERGQYLSTESYREFVEWGAGFAKMRHAWLLRKPGVVAEMLANRLSDAPEADTFWSLVFTESHPDSNHETRELSRTLKTFHGKPKVGQDRFRREAAKQWRRFRRSVTTPAMPSEQSPEQDAATA